MYAGVPTVDFGCEWSTEDWEKHNCQTWPHIDPMKNWTKEAEYPLNAVEQMVILTQMFPINPYKFI